jgi:8-oxo-dGTP diphosphatase
VNERPDEGHDLLNPRRSRPRIDAKITADLVVLTIREETLKVLVVTRGTSPFAGHLALPGGFVRADEDLEAAAHRELLEETQLDSEYLHLQLTQIATYSAPDRDPRGRVVSTAFLAIAPDLPTPLAGSDAEGSHWASVDSATSDGLAFDHATILRDGLDVARHKLQYETIATSFCGPTFTMGELRRVYEIVCGVTIDESNFGRDVGKREGFIVATGDKRHGTPGRPAALYRWGGARFLEPPMPTGYVRVAPATALVVGGSADPSALPDNDPTDGQPCNRQASEPMTPCRFTVR